MGMPVKKLWDPNEQIVLPEEYLPGKHHPTSPAIAAGDDPAALNHPVKTNGVANTAVAVPMSQPALISKKAGIGTAASAGVKDLEAARKAEESVEVQLSASVPPAPAAEVEAVKIPADVTADAAAATKAEHEALAREKQAEADVKRYATEAKAYEAQVEADSALLTAERQVKEATAAAEQAKRVGAASADGAPAPVEPEGDAPEGTKSAH